MNRPIKWILGILGSLLLAALGNGFREWFLRDFFTWCGHSILTLITLGIGSVRDSFYVDIAKGRTDRLTSCLVSFAWAFLCAMAGLLGGILSGTTTQLTAESSHARRTNLRIRRLGLCTLLILVFTLGFPRDNCFLYARARLIISNKHLPFVYRLCRRMSATIFAQSSPASGPRLIMFAY